MNTNLTTTQAAAFLTTDPSTVRRWCESGRMTATKFGHIWVIDSDALVSFKRPARGRPPNPRPHSHEWFQGYNTAGMSAQGNPYELNTRRWCEWHNGYARGLKDQAQLETAAHEGKADSGKETDG